MIIFLQNLKHKLETPLQLVYRFFIAICKWINSSK